MADINEVSRVRADNGKQYWAVRDRTKTVLCANRAVADQLCQLLNDWNERISSAISVNVYSGHWNFSISHDNMQVCCRFEMDGGVLTVVDKVSRGDLHDEMKEARAQRPLEQLRGSGYSITKDPDPDREEGDLKEPLNQVEQYKEPQNGKMYWRVVTKNSDVFERCANKAIADKLCKLLNERNCSVTFLNGTAYSGHYNMYVDDSLRLQKHYLGMSYKQGCLVDLVVADPGETCSEWVARRDREDFMLRKHIVTGGGLRDPDEEMQVHTPAAETPVEKRLTVEELYGMNAAELATATKHLEVLQHFKMPMSMHSAGVHDYLNSRIDEQVIAQIREERLRYETKYAAQAPAATPPTTTAEVAQPAATPNQPTTAEQATQEEEVMANNKIDLKSEAVEAGIRTSVTQVVKLLHEPLVALITAKLAVPGENPEAFAKRVAEFLKDDIGRAMVSGLLGLAFQNLPPAALASLGISGDMSERISRELRVNAMALVGGQVADLLMDPLRNVASGFAAQTGGKVRAVFEQNGIGVGVLNQEEESVPARDAVAKANEMAR